MAQQLFFQRNEQVNMNKKTDFSFNHKVHRNDKWYFGRHDINPSTKKPGCSPGKRNVCGFLHPKKMLCGVTPKMADDLLLRLLKSTLDITMGKSKILQGVCMGNKILHNHKTTNIKIYPVICWLLQTNWTSFAKNNTVMQSTKQAFLGVETNGEWNSSNNFAPPSYKPLSKRRNQTCPADEGC